MASDNQKRGLYAKIAIARKQLPDMDEEAYRARLRAEFGVDSAAKLSVAQLSRLVHDFAREGVVYTAPAKAKNTAAKPQSRPDWIEVTDSMPYAQVKRQICAIWRKLGYDLLSLEGRVKRQFKVDSFLWLHDVKSLHILQTDLQARLDRKRKREGKIVMQNYGNNKSPNRPKKTPSIASS